LTGWVPARWSARTIARPIRIQYLGAVTTWEAVKGRILDPQP